ncbi:MAG: DUF1343 domain-containing protein [Candidatus Marinimicrobia bacterium]|nr:DUF1343 domain-containing protein [Candidatus Neomarinimicrobiota bacterium]
MKSIKSIFAMFIILFLFLGCSTQSGLDIAAKDNFPMLKGKNVGIVTNHTAKDKNGNHIVDLIHADSITIKAIYAPEHGFRGEAAAGDYVADNIDPATGAPIYSIYGSTRKPTEEMLEGVEVLIFDIQDIGARFYTYISTMGNIMEAGANHNIPVYILDRPNPIGRIAEGPIIEQEFYSFVGMYPIPIRHGMTVGELAMMIKDKAWIENAEQLDLHIIEISDWNPDKPYENTKSTWIPPSPNMRNVNEALLYPGMCLFEATNFSEGRGTEHPFEWVGANFINSDTVIAKLEKRNLAGIEILPISFIPEDMPGYSMNPKYEGKICYGLELKVTDPSVFKSVEFGINLIEILHNTYPDKFVITRERWMNMLWGNRNAFQMILSGKSATEIIDTYHQELSQFIRIREEYFLYK